MRLYLMRHGRAVERDEWSGADEKRPLTPDGVARTRAVLQELHRRGKLAVKEVWTSPLARARQTAELAGEVLGLPVTECRALARGPTLESLARAFKRRPPPEELLLVGHEPGLSGLLAELTGEREGRSLKKAGVACLQGDFKPRGMELAWQVGPKEVLGD